MRRYLLLAAAALLLVAAPVVAKPVADILRATILVADQELRVNGAEVMAGGPSPLAGDCLAADTGSLYLRRAPTGDGNSTGELWLKVGIYACEWLRVAP